MAQPARECVLTQDEVEVEESDSPYPCLYNVGHEVTIKGRVVRITKNYMLERTRRYTCSRCRAIADGETKYNDYFASVIPKCPNRSKDCTGYMRLATKEPDHGDLIKFQEVMLQEIDSPVSIPRIFLVTLEDTLVDLCSPGESVEVQGTVEMRANALTHSKSNITIAIRCQSVRNLDGTRWNADLEEMMRVAGEKWRNLVKSEGEMVARDILLRCSFPNVKGMDYVKLSLLLLMTGSAQGIQTKLDTPIRCQSHALLVGDSGTAKSQLLKWVAKYMSPSLYTNAIGCTSAGLTAAAIKTGAHWTLQAGVLVLCDGGVCCIDEWNLLKPVDQASCHEAMEQQSVSIAKAGILTKLRTRCSIVAATVPKKAPKGLDMTTEMTGLSSSLISRFDLIMWVPDIKDADWDVELADFLLNFEEEEGERVFGDADVRAHLMVARDGRPVFDEGAYEVITAYYSFCRNDEFRDYGRTTVRLQEGLIRLASGHARLVCRKRVTVVDAVVAIMIMESSIGFGRLMRPFNLTKEGRLPLEPSVERVREVLRLLGVNGEVFKEEEYNWKGEGEVDEDIREVKRRRLNEDEEIDRGGVELTVKLRGAMIAEGPPKRKEKVMGYLSKVLERYGGGIKQAVGGDKGEGGGVEEGEKDRVVKSVVVRNVENVGGADDDVARPSSSSGAAVIEEPLKKDKLSSLWNFSNREGQVDKGIDDWDQLVAKNMKEVAQGVVIECSAMARYKAQEASRERAAAEESSKMAQATLIEKNNSTIAAVEETIDKGNCSLDALISKMQENVTQDRVAIAIDVEVEEGQDEAPERNGEAEREVIVNRPEVLNIDQSSLDSLLLQMQEQNTETLAITEDMEKKDDKDDGEEEEEEDGDPVPLSQISLHSLLNRLKAHPSQKNSSINTQLEKLNDQERRASVAETLQMRMNDFESSQKPEEIEEQNDATPAIEMEIDCNEVVPDPSEPSHNSPKEPSTITHSLLDEDSMDNQILSQLIIPEEKTVESQQPEKQNQLQIEKEPETIIQVLCKPAGPKKSSTGEPLEDQEEYDFGVYLKTLDFSLLQKLPKQLMFEGDNFYQTYFEMKPDSDDDVVLTDSTPV